MGGCWVRMHWRWSKSAFWTIAFNNYDVELSIMSRTNGMIIVHTQLPGRTHMICVNSFHICLMVGPLDIVRYFIYAFIYYETLGWSLKQKGYCNILLLCVSDVTYSLRKLVCKWSGSLYDSLLCLWILMMRLWFMMLCYVFFFWRKRL